ncbi:MAG: histidine kinase dimerization/phospho-acceptor domain-containing protein, partial [Dehalococcoidia bacterium]|nr:histidine kinase dimerization/phospho-acceptor domain-containing protein [Dehalococcoidia bacterium]
MTPDAAAGLGEKIARRLLAYSPLGRLVRWVAGLQVSVHTKLLGAYLLVTLLFVAMGAMSLETIASLSRHSQLLDEAHKRVDTSRQVEHALAMQMNFTAMALVFRDEATITSILRENNRFNDTLARIEQDAPSEEREIIGRVRSAQDEVLIIVADIANLVRDGKIEQAMKLQLVDGYPLYRRIEELVGQVVRIEEGKMDRLRLSVAAANRRAPLLMGGFVVAAIVLALFLGFVISWSFILPVREAEGFLGRLSKGDFGGTITVPNRDEFGALAARMNEMSRELARLYASQREAARQLEVLNAELERASKAKSDFLASMSHELRTPMNAILGFTEMILDEVYGEVPEDVKERVGDIQACGRQLLHLINDVLDLAKIEAGRMELSPGDYLVPDIVATVRTSLASLAMEKGLEFLATADDDLPVAFGDGKRITQCLINLTGNALKFTQQGRVEIRVDRQGDMLLYRVSDTGIG